MWRSFAPTKNLVGFCWYDLYFQFWVPFPTPGCKGASVQLATPRGQDEYGMVGTSSNSYGWVTETPQWCDQSHQLFN